MARGLNPTPRMPRAPKPYAPAKAVVAPPRMKPTSTREYGKGGQPQSSYLNDPMKWGSNVGYGG